MLIFLYGKDAYRVVENSQKIIASYFAKHKSGLNFHEFDFENGGQVVKLEDSIKSLSFFDEVKLVCIFFFQAEDGIRDWSVTGVQTCALPILSQKYEAHSLCDARFMRKLPC